MSLPVPTKNPLLAAGFFMAREAMRLAPDARRCHVVIKWKVLA
jgi:hypothetical protein